MEAQGMNLFSLLPGTPQLVAGNQVMPSTHNTVSWQSKPEFFEVFRQFTYQFHDGSIADIDFESVPSAVVTEIADQPPEQLPVHFLPSELSGRPLTPLSPPVQQIFQDGQNAELESETAHIQNNAVSRAGISEKSEQPLSNTQGEQRALPVAEIKMKEVTDKKTDTDASSSILIARTTTSESDSISETVHSSKTKHNELPVIETVTDKTSLQNHTLTQTTASERLKPASTVERTQASSGINIGIPVATSSVEPSPVIDPSKPLIPETGLQSTVRQSVPAPEVPLNRLGQTLIQMISKGEQKLEFRLDPPELGKLTMTVAMERDSVSVQMLTGSQAVKDLLLMQVDRLRTSLADESITLGQMSVDIGDQNTQSQKQATSIETLLVADGGSESGEYKTASMVFKAQGGRLLDYFV